MDQKGKERFDILIQNIKAETLTSYTGAVNPITIRCAKGHVFTTKPYQVNRGRWCPQCRSVPVETYLHKIRMLRVTPSKDSLKKIKAKKGRVVKKSNDKLQIKCKKNHYFTLTETAILNNKWCDKCK